MLTSSQIKKQKEKKKMEQKTYEIIIETLVDELELERWRLKQVQEELAATNRELETLKRKVGNDG